MWKWPFGKAAKQRRAEKRDKEIAVALRMAPAAVDSRFEGKNIAYVDKDTGKVQMIVGSGMQSDKTERAAESISREIARRAAPIKPRLSSPPVGTIGRNTIASRYDRMDDFTDPLSPLNPISPLSPMNLMMTDSAPAASCPPDSGSSSSSSYSSSDSGSSFSSDSGSSGGGCD